MNARVVFISLTCVLVGGQGAIAEDVRGLDRMPATNILPTIEVVAPARAPSRRSGRGGSAVRHRSPALPRPFTAARLPQFDDDRIAGSVSRIDSKLIEHTQSLNLPDALRQHVPGLAVNDVAGNPFQPNVQFRGFTASPIAGTSQGLALYQNGMRINEAFGDIANWDLVPTAAIRSVAVVANNPAYGLNALGGAIDVRMKDGFVYNGAGTDTMGG